MISAARSYPKITTILLKQCTASNGGAKRHEWVWSRIIQSNEIIF